MALVVEDGTGRADAESYCSVAAATAYHAARGNAAWAALADDTVREQLLRKATGFMASYGWKGTRVAGAQALDWPRIGVAANGFLVPSDVVPLAVQQACAELALRAASADLAPDLGPLATRVKVGPIEEEYAEGGRQSTVYVAVSIMLGAYLAGGSGSISLVRA